MKRLIIFLALNFGLFFTGFSQEYIREDIIKLTEISKDKKYGYTQKKPIKTGKVSKGYHFLNALRGPDGEKVSYQRKGSCCDFESEAAALGTGFLDIYIVWYEGGQPVTLYINNYEYEDLKCPTGFTFITSDAIKTDETSPD